MTVQLAQNNIDEIQKGAELLGIKLIQSDLELLQAGETLSLSSKKLAEIGTAFILAQSIAELCSVDCTCFQDLCSEQKIKQGKQKKNFSGLPVYCWKKEGHEYCVLFTIQGCNPALKCELSSEKCEPSSDKC
jgi:hypothetical protein